jgi:hypothetical protein
MRDSHRAPRYYAPPHFYRALRGALNRGNPSRAIEARMMKTRPSDAREVMFIITYADGRLRYVTISNMDLRNGDGAAFAVAARKQETGEIPAGTIIGVKRVH